MAEIYGQNMSEEEFNNLYKEKVARIISNIDINKFDEGRNYFVNISLNQSMVLLIIQL